jgi:hypothetical protein
MQCSGVFAQKYPHALTALEQEVDHKIPAGDAQIGIVPFRPARSAGPPVTRLQLAAIGL